MRAIRSYSPNDYPPLPDSQIEATARKLPDALFRFGDAMRHNGQYVATAVMLTDCRDEAGITEVHAVNALHWLAKR